MTEIDKEDYVVEHPYVAQDNDEVTLRVGDVVRKVEEKDGGWWRGSVRNGQGYFPSSHVKQLRLSDIIFQADRNCGVVFDYEPCQEDELRLCVGDKVHVLGEVELGWWRGRIGDQVGTFPASHISVSSNTSYRNETSLKKDFKNVGCEILIDAQSPVQLRRNSSRLHFTPLSLNMDACSKDPTPVSANLFDPEDEPAGPLYDTSISSSIKTDTLDCSESLSESKSKGIISRLRHSMGSKPKLPKFLSRRLSSGSFMETQSTCSPTVTRRNSLADFFRRGSSCSVRLCDETKNYRKKGILSRLSRSWDTAIPDTKPTVLSPAVDILELKELKNACLFESNTEQFQKQSDSWVWEGRELNMMWQQVVSKKREDFISGDSGYVDNDIAVGAEPFGPVAEVTDEVFKDMFASNNTNNQVDGCLSQDKIETTEATTPLPAKSKERTKIITSFGEISSVGSLRKRSLIKTNPFISWKKSEEVTEI